MTNLLGNVQELRAQRLPILSPAALRRRYRNLGHARLLRNIVPPAASLDSSSPNVSRWRGAAYLLSTAQGGADVVDEDQLALMFIGGESIRLLPPDGCQESEKADPSKTRNRPVSSGILSNGPVSALSWTGNPAT